MTREAKVGLMMVAIVCGVFGFLLYKRMHRPTEAMAEQSVQVNQQAEEPVVVNDRNPFEDEPVPERKRAQRRKGQEIELASHHVESFAADVADVDAPLAKEKRRRDQPAVPIELTSNDEDFGQFTKSKAKRDEPQRSHAIEPADDAFGSDPDPQMKPPKSIAGEERHRKDDPFAADDSPSSSVQPVQFDEPVERDRKVPLPIEATDRKPSNGFRTSISATDSFAQLDEPRRNPGFDNEFDAAPQSRRRSAPTASLDERTSTSDSVHQAGSGDGKSYVIQPNDNFWSISRKRYGAGRYYKALAIHNQQTISDPKMMKPGMVISTPDVTVLEQRYADVIPKASTVDSVSSVSTTQSRPSTGSEPSGYFVAADGAPMYRVGEQDTLTGIAKSHLGRTTRWVQILEMNRNVLRDGNELKIGTVLRLPGDASRVQVVGTARELR